MPATVTALHVYPVKSCRGIAVDAWPVERRGLAHDRRWMVVDEGGTFLTQRTVPALGRVEVAFAREDGGPLSGFTLSAPGHAPCALPLTAGPDVRDAADARDAREVMDVTVWRHRGPAHADAL
jgi:uncharacterized protein YcbX